MSVCRRAKLQKTAAFEAQNADAERMSGMPAYDRLLMELQGHQRHLSLLQSRDAKIAYKTGILPVFDPHVEGVIGTGDGAQDDILVTVLVWRIDVGDIAGALEIADYAIPLGLDSPPNFKRDLKNAVTEEVAEYILDHPEMDNAEEHLLHLELLVENLDMIDEVKSSLMKALGVITEPTNIDDAITYFEEALRLNEKCGVKGIVKKLRKQKAGQEQVEAEIKSQPQSNLEPEPEVQTQPGPEIETQSDPEQLQPETKPKPKSKPRATEPATHQPE